MARTGIGFVVRNSAGGQSTTWKVVCAGDDLYVCPIRLPWFKVSLHRDGANRACFALEQLNLLPAKITGAIRARSAGRQILSWDPQPLDQSGTRLLLRILVPSLAVSKAYREMRHVQMVEDGGTGTATEFSLILTSQIVENCPASRSLGLRSLGHLDRARGDRAWVCWRQGLAQDLMPPSGSRSIPRETFEGVPSEGLHALFFGVDTHGAAWIAEYCASVTTRDEARTSEH